MKKQLLLSLLVVGFWAAGQNNVRFVIDHYNAGGVSHKYADERIEPLGLNTSEKAALVAFLRSLTDERFLEFDWRP